MFFNAFDFGTGGNIHALFSDLPIMHTAHLRRSLLLTHAFSTLSSSALGDYNHNDEDYHHLHCHYCHQPRSAQDSTSDGDSPTDSDIPLTQLALLALNPSPPIEVNRGEPNTELQPNPLSVTNVSQIPRGPTQIDLLYHPTSPLPSAHLQADSSPGTKPPLQTLEDRLMPTRMEGLFSPLHDQRGQNRRARVRSPITMRKKKNTRRRSQEIKTWLAGWDRAWDTLST